MKAEQLSPSWIFFAVLALIFCAEEALTYALDHFLPQAISQDARAIIDAGALTLIMSLFIWWLVMRPLRQALMSEAAMAKAVADAAVDAIVTTDERGSIESFNPAAVMMFGYAANEVIGKDVAMLMNESRASEYLRYIADHVRRGGTRTTGLSREFLAQRKDRSEFPVELTMAVTTLGGARRFTSIIRDISERKRMEQALRASASELRLIIDTVPAMIVYYDASLRCRFANKRYADFFGFDATDIAGRHLREIVGDAAYDVAEDEFRKALTGQPLTYERMQVLRNGESVPLEIKLVPHAGETGKLLGSYGLLVDITQRKVAEERIRRLTNYDSLTGLADRTLFYHRLGQDITAARRDHKELALIYLSLDKFKYVNDTLGHHAGDQVLALVGERIRYQAHKSDTVARMGGDEFAVIMSDGVNRRDAAEVSEKIIGALSKRFYLDGQKHAVQIGASVGIAIFPANAQDADNLVETAYAAMEKGKAGKGKPAVFKDLGQR
jgi:diguanylate cyclase (GGDEF)-like protein/PAS domain S-box-containing protein